MAKTLYVGNLPWSTKEDELISAFEAHGEVISARVVTDRVTGRSRGFGFIEVDDDVSEKMIKTMNGFNLGGRDLIVNESRPKKQTPGTERAGSESSIQPESNE